MQKTDSLETILMLGMIEGRRRSGWWRMRLLNGITDSRVWASSGVGDRQWSLVYCSPWDCKELDMTELLNWEFLRIHFSFLLFVLILIYRGLCFQLFSYLLPCWTSKEKSEVPDDINFSWISLGHLLNYKNFWSIYKICDFKLMRFHCVVEKFMCISTFIYLFVSLKALNWGS